MTNEHEFTVKFVTPDAVEEENVLLVLREFFGDLVQTDRFVDAVVKTDESNINEGERERLIAMMDALSDEEIDDIEQFIDELDRE